MGAMGRHRTCWFRPEVDLVGAQAEGRAELAHLRDLGGAPPALPQVDGVGLDADLERQLELGPAAGLPQGTDRVHPPLPSVS
jgi:hypothetical protein